MSKMSQQLLNLPKFAQIVRRNRTLIGILTALGLLAGAVFATLHPETFTSKALVVAEVPSCPPGASCAAGPQLLTYDIHARFLKVFPYGVQIKPLTGNVLSVSARAGTAAQAQALANAAARSYIAMAASPANPGGRVSAQLEPATRAAGPTAPEWLVLDALLGAISGALLGIITALAASGTTVDPMSAA